MKKRLSILLFLCFFVLGSSFCTNANSLIDPSVEIPLEKYDIAVRSVSDGRLLQRETLENFGELVRCVALNPDATDTIAYTLKDKNGFQFRLFSDYGEEPFGEFKNRKPYDGYATVFLSSDDLRFSEDPRPEGSSIKKLIYQPAYDMDYCYDEGEDFCPLEYIQFWIGDTRYQLYGSFESYPIDKKETLISRLLDKRTAEDAAKEIREILREEKQVSAGSAKIAPVYWWILGGIGVAEAGLLVWILLLLRKVKRQLKMETFLRPQPQEAPPESKQTE